MQVKDIMTWCINFWKLLVSSGFPCLENIHSPVSGLLGVLGHT